MPPSCHAARSVHLLLSLLLCRSSVLAGSKRRIVLKAFEKPSNRPIVTDDVEGTVAARMGAVDSVKAVASGSKRKRAMAKSRCGRFSTEPRGALFWSVVTLLTSISSRHTFCSVAASLGARSSLVGVTNFFASAVLHQPHALAVAASNGQPTIERKRRLVAVRRRSLRRAAEQR